MPRPAVLLIIYKSVLPPGRKEDLLTNRSDLGHFGVNKKKLTKNEMGFFVTAPLWPDCVSLSSPGDRRSPTDRGTVGTSLPGDWRPARWTGEDTPRKEGGAPEIRHDRRWSSGDTPQLEGDDSEICHDRKV